MGIFSSILEKLRHPLGNRQHEAQASPQQQQFQPASNQQGTPAQPQAQQQPIDMEAVMAQYAKSHGGGGNWRESIVDLLKMLGLDSSLENRKELARELGYKGDTNDSAAMNIWLHKQVMTQLAAHGGKVPAELKD